MRCWIPWRRPPDFIIGSADNPYLLRWWLLPRNHLFNVYLHHIKRDDDDRALHDHPWWNISIILKGGYDEITPTGRKLRRAGSVVFRRATTAHRLALPVINGGITYCWSLFITGPRIREWGFHCPQGWRVWHEFVDSKKRGQVGRGCE
jgi:hypothetical protein